MGATRNKPGARRHTLRNGLGQLTLVEHALCPLEPAASLAKNLVHNTEYSYTDSKRRRLRSSVRVFCPLGLSAHDELLLWGLLALTLAQTEPTGQLCATPHYCLKQLGLIDQHSRRGGRQYQQFVVALERLSVVRYLNSHFYDPIRAEHRRVSFGFFSYSLPLDPTSGRAWRIAWDPVFFEFVKSSSGAFRFDLSLYRELDPASRRLFLFVSKVFCRRETTPRLDVRHLGEHILGFAPSLKTWDLRIKLRRCFVVLRSRDVLGEMGMPAFQKTADGRESVILRRGRYFERRTRSDPCPSESPLYQPLADLGVDQHAIDRMLAKFPHQLLSEWLDITLAAKERFGSVFFKRSPAAYFVDNVTQAHGGRRTPPDWWHEVRKAEEQARANHARSQMGTRGGRLAPGLQASQAFDSVRDDIFRHFLAVGQSVSDAKTNADRFAQEHSSQRRSQVAGTKSKE